MVMEIANQGKIGNLLINGRPLFFPLHRDVEHHGIKKGLRLNSYRGKSVTIPDRGKAL
jgi:hypothetical protein